jgi:hypothetical protein
MNHTMSKLFLISFLAPTVALSAAAQSRPSKQPQSSQSSDQQTSASVSESNSTSASASAGPASAGLASGTTINSELTSAVDARKCQPGQKITAKTTRDVKQNGRVVLHKGTRLVGHVSRVEYRSKENAESAVGIVFDEAIMKDGEHVPFHASIQALGEAQAAADAADDDGGMMAGAAGGAAGGAMGSARGGLLGGGGAVGSVAGNAGAMAGGLDRTAGGAVGAASSTTGATAGRVGGLNAAGQLTSDSRGVFGMQGLNLESSVSNATEGSLITSKSRNVHLSSGTQMLLAVAAQ